MSAATPAAPIPTSPVGTPPPLPEPIRLMGVPLHPVTAAGALDHIAASAAAGRGGWVLTPNLEILRRLTREPETAALCEPVTLRLADGMPLIWASRLQRTPLPERVPGSDLIWSLSGRAAAEGLSIFLLGGNPGAADAAAAELVARFPGLKVAGTECPPIGFEGDAGYLDRLRERLVVADPNIVYVALGFPKQERLIARLWPALPRAWFLGIGISFSFVSGEVKRAPRWMQAAGLEWMHRLAQEPSRLARRYLVHGLPFAARLLALSAAAGIMGRGSGNAAAGATGSRDEGVSK